jgi:uncharacterized protein YecE (DUF72 family)
MIRVGIGGWTFQPWRGPFYPKGLAQARELGFASRAVTAIEINGTFYGSQKPESFRKWHDETPEDFVFSLKGPRFATNRRELATAGESVGRFFASGVLELKDKLGPVLWQMAPTKKFDPGDFEGFLTLLPREIDGRAIRHVVEVRHESFAVPEFVTLLRKHQMPVVYADSDDYPAIADVTGDFVYARLQRAAEAEPAGYPGDQLDAWAERARVWAAGGTPADLPTVAAKPAAKRQRPVFLYMINGAKVRAPAAAQALIERLKRA